MTRPDMRAIEMSLRRFNAALEALEEALRRLPPPDTLIAHGGWSVPSDQAYDITCSDFVSPDPRQGEEVYVYDLLPGARVYVLEDVFTVDRVDMDAPLPTVWLKELPTSPLYFTEDEYIYLAIEPKD